MSSFELPGSLDNAHLTEAYRKEATKCWAGMYGCGETADWEQFAGLCEEHYVEIIKG